MADVQALGREALIPLNQPCRLPVCDVPLRVARNRPMRKGGSMNAIQNTTATYLEWQEPVPQEPRFELHSGEEVLATLALEPLCRTLATAKTQEGTWTFEQTGILHSRVHVLEAESGQEIAVFNPGFLGRGVLRFGNGVAFSWRRESHHGGWSFRGGDGEILVTLKLKPSPPDEPWPRRTQAEVHFEAAGQSNPRTPLLAALGWYLILLQD